jgi:hypothetical protein
LDIDEPPDRGGQSNDLSPFGTTQVIERCKFPVPCLDGVLDALTQTKPGVAADILLLVMENWRARLASGLAW